jgi:periplasmic divalent cation tolerance protein
MTQVVIFITTANEKEAERIAGELVKSKLAACVNVIENIRSLFWWQGKVDSAKELLLIVKTKKTLIPKLIEKVKSLHSYEVPEIIALPVIGGYKKYLEWINESTR